MDTIFNKEYNVIQPNWEIQKITLKDILTLWKKTLLFFYPKDNTPGCTLENKDFSCLKWKFQNLWIQLIGISEDSIEEHKIFIFDHQLWNTLISDETWELHRFFSAYWEKNMYWKIFQWVIRTSILLDNKWNILKSWNNVKATGHAQRILQELTT